MKRFIILFLFISVALSGSAQIDSLYIMIDGELQAIPSHGLEVQEPQVEESYNIVSSATPENSRIHATLERLADFIQNDGEVIFVKMRKGFDDEASPILLSNQQQLTTTLHIPQEDIIRGFRTINE